MYTQPTQHGVTGGRPRNPVIPRARHRLGVILGAFAPGVGVVSDRPSQPSLLGPAPACQADTNGGALAPAGGWFGFVPARDKRLRRRPPPGP